MELLFSWVSHWLASLTLLTVAYVYDLQSCLPGQNMEEMPLEFSPHLDTIVNSLRADNVTAASLQWDAFQSNFSDTLSVQNMTYSLTYITVNAYKGQSEHYSSILSFIQDHVNPQFKPVSYAVLLNHTNQIEDLMLLAYYTNKGNIILHDASRPVYTQLTKVIMSGRPVTLWNDLYGGYLYPGAGWENKTLGTHNVFLRKQGGSVYQGHWILLPQLGHNNSVNFKIYSPFWNHVMKSGEQRGILTAPYTKMHDDEDSLWNLSFDLDPWDSNLLRITVSSKSRSLQITAMEDEEDLDAFRKQVTMGISNSTAAAQWIILLV